MSEIWDVLIVGAGAGGSAVAAYLSDFDINVICLEQGDFPNINNLPSTKSNWETFRWSEFSPNPNVRKLKEDYPINCDESPIAVANYNAVGGSTVLFSGHYPRFHPSDFKVKSVDGIAEDWPISYAELEPFYELNRKFTAVAGLEGDPAYPEIKNLLPPVPIGKMGEKLAKGFNSMNWHWWPAYSAIATRKFGDHAPCINLGPCNLGCPQGAKSSADVSHWPHALRNKVQLQTGCRVSQVLVNEFNQAIGVKYFDRSGKEREIRSLFTVLACNGVGTPRILLNSKSDLNPKGIGNSNDLVGRNLMLHPLAYVEGIFEENLDSHLGPQGCSIASHEFVESSPARGFVRGFTMQALRGPGLSEATRSYQLQKVLEWGNNHHESVRKRYSRTAHLSIIVEDLPELSNRVELDPILKDSNGIPAPKVTYKLGENTKRCMAFGINKAREVLIASGAHTTSAFGPVRETGWHLMGTACMGDNPATSVTDKWGEVHDCENLFIADSSVFVTSSSVNPTATIQALALRTAARINERFRS
jgi:choline dehydrogenase-like flavoprotein